MKALRIAAIVFGVWVLVGVGLDAALGYFQPRSADSVVLRTLDANGQPHDTALGAREIDGQVWLVSGQWFRGWYRRALANPDVELTRNGAVTAYRAIPVDTREAVDAVTRLDRERTGAGYWFGRGVLALFAPYRLLRLDPRTPPAS